MHNFLRKEPISLSPRSSGPFPNTLLLIMIVVDNGFVLPYGASIPDRLIAATWLEGGPTIRGSDKSPGRRLTGCMVYRSSGAPASESGECRLRSTVTHLIKTAPAIRRSPGGRSRRVCYYSSRRHS